MELATIFWLVVLFFIFMGLMQARSNAKKRKKLGVSIMGVLKHVNGLPIPEDMPCELLSYLDRYEIKANGLVFNLQKDKVSDICIKKHTEIQKQVVSSIGGAIGGAVLFGPLGAIIGGRAKTKKVVTKTKYLIFTYLKDEEVKYLGFLVDDHSSEYLALKIKNEFMKMETNNVKQIQIDL